ncbi:root phototropism protein 3-like isoform X2 [Papaver somniferum]|uniref:root phototropism protein 3-like isoform X2 n=1 Tax=Papaver somniferum TaxID=3469 RepID=UPI000E703C07|nr:root phototropism protein 3-like isoform X2 [Papaver somniferum]
MFNQDTQPNKMFYQDAQPRRKVNQCVSFPSNQQDATGRTSLERRKNRWFIQTNVTSDLIINVEENIFHLHKVPMVSKSVYINKLVFEGRNDGGRNSVLSINIENLPDFEQGNLISKTETFFSFIIFSSWKHTIQILKSCETIPSLPKDLKLEKRCTESLAWKASLETKSIYKVENMHNSDTTRCKENMPGGCDSMDTETWWFEDVSVLRVDHFVGLINAVKRKNMRFKLVGSCIEYWALKRLPSMAKHGFGLKEKDVQRVTIRSLIEILPVEENSVSCSFLLHLLKVGLILDIDPELTRQVESRLVLMLEKCCTEDLTVRNYSDNQGIYDVDIVVKVVKAYETHYTSNSTSRIYVVASLVDEYLMSVVAKDDQLSVKTFLSLVEALPKNARVYDDKLYTAMDMYLKSHPTLTEEERSGICKFLQYDKLSKEAKNHAMNNDRLPLKVTIKFLLLEQLNMTSNFVRTKSQAIARRELAKRWEKAQKEIAFMKDEMEKMKIQFNDLKKCGGTLRNKMGLYLESL